MVPKAVCDKRRLQTRRLADSQTYRLADRRRPDFHARFVQVTKSTQILLHLSQEENVSEPCSFSRKFGPLRIVRWLKSHRDWTCRPQTSRLLCSVCSNDEIYTNFTALITTRERFRTVIFFEKIWTITNCQMA